MVVRSLATLVTVGLAVAGCSGGDGRSAGRDPGAAGDDEDARAALIASVDDQGSLNTPCAYSHSAPDDPIVHPGHTGMSHRHDFFGATTTSGASDVASLMEGDTTCRSVADHSAYWAPSLLSGGTPIEPLEMIAYYRVPVGADATEVQAPPNGLEMIAGDPAATAPQDTTTVGWTCGSSTDASAVPRNCPAGSEQHLRLRFDPCWDGEHLSSDDHRSHLEALGDGGACPPTHPVLIPEITLDLRYPSSGSSAPLTLASGPVTGGHGDVLVAWDDDHIAGEVATCLQANLNCDVVSESTRLGFDELG